MSNIDTLERSSPDRAEVEAALNRVLGSRVFETAARSRDFLRFIVEEALAGRAERLKGYTIAVAVFERPPGFDAQSDPLVRVEAGRLRRRLAEYYHGDGRGDAVRIDLPRGGYAPTFARVSAASTASVERPPTGEPTHRRGLGALLAAALLVAAATAAVVWQVVESPREPDAVSTAAAPTPAPSTSVTARIPRLVVLPLTSLDGPLSSTFARGTTEEIIHALVDFNIFATASPATQSLEPASLRSLRSDFNAGYALSGSVRTDDRHVRVAIRLTDTEFGTQLWTGAFDQELDGAGVLLMQQTIGQSVAKLVSSPYGPVYTHEIERLATNPSATVDPYECLLRFYAYTRSFDPAGHVESVRCLQRAVVSEPGFAQAWSALATVYLHEHVFGYNPQPDREPALDRALEAVRRSLDIGGGGRIAAVALAGIRLASGDRDGFAEAAERALAIAPVHPAVQGQIGYLLTLSGNWQRGIALIDEALPLTANVPGWYYNAYALKYLQTQKYDLALEWALKIDAPNWYMTPLVTAASAALAGRQDVAEREVARLLTLDPDFASTGRELLSRGQMDDKLLETLIDGLRLAGLAIL